MRGIVSILASVTIALTLAAGRADAIEYTFKVFSASTMNGLVSAGGINEAGDVAGAYVDSSGRAHGYVHANGIDSIFDVPGSRFTYATDLDDQGRVIGTFGGTAPYRDYGFIYSGGAFTVFNVPGAVGTELVGINSVGQILGFYRSPDYMTHSFIYSDATGITEIEVPAGDTIYVSGINDRGAVVGLYQENTNGRRYYGFVYADGVFRKSDGAAGLLWPSGINAAADIIGGPAYPDLTDGVLIDGVFTIVNVPGASFTSTYGINNSGQIVGSYYDSDSQGGNFIATPVPTLVSEPSSFALLLAGGVGIVFIRARRA